ncbi:MAG: molybdenum cofactor biosynthesis protein MoaC, partial [Halanaerobiales bacterium]|nr:molybdenum cofactor biosynthesis protein MoaC [Halanaerobiales bacterium]
MDGKVKAVCISREKGTKKENIEKAKLIKNFGIEDDAHAGDWHRQVSLLGIESIEKMKQMGMDLELDFGDFAENITTEGIELYT